ncbi:MAG: hypothetical protein JWN34_2844 [Bryobacterales bacterium]|nr:hypothetical protein [Bryobacterales bacterium]
MPDSFEGFEDAKKLLSDLPRRLVRRGLRKAVTAAAVVVAEAIHARTPQSTKATHTDPHLADSLVVDVEVDEAAGSAHAEIGFGKQGYRALWVEYGHQQVSHGGKPGPFVPANPFMRSAGIAAGDAAEEAFVAALTEASREELE